MQGKLNKHGLLRQRGLPRTQGDIYLSDCPYDLVNWPAQITLPTVMACVTTVGEEGHKIFGLLIHVNDVPKANSVTTEVHHKLCRGYQNCPPMMKFPVDGGNPAGYLFDDLTSSYNSVFNSGVSGPKHWYARVTKNVWVSMQHLLGARQLRLEQGLPDMFKNYVDDVTSILPIRWRLHLSVANMCAEKSVPRGHFEIQEMESEFQKSRSVLERWMVQVQTHTVKDFGLEWPDQPPLIMHSDFLECPKKK